MPAKKPQRPPTRPRVVAPVTGDEVTPFSQRLLADATQRAADQLRDRTSLTVDLVVGDNVINHRLGRQPSGATITPSVADATWAWAMKAASTSQVTLTCIGVAQPKARVEVY